MPGFAGSGISKRTVTTPFTGATAILAATARIAPGVPFRLLGVRMHLSAAGTTTENFTVTCNAGDGSAYDAVLLKRNLSVGSVVDLVWSPTGKQHIYEADDVIEVAWTNTELRTYGLVILHEVL